MKRLFVGILIPEVVGEKIKLIQDELVQTGADLKLVSSNNLHFTIKFLGSEEDSKISQIVQKLDAILLQKKKFMFSVQNVGFFPNTGHISVVWVGAESNELVSLIKEANQSLDYIRKNEHGEEIPHLTVARINSGKNKEQLRGVVEKFKSEVFGQVLVDKIILFESVLTPQGPVYTVVKEFLLRS